MLIEQDSAVLLEESDDLTSIYVGGIWDEFKNLLPEPQAKILIKGFNLIILSSIPEFDTDNSEFKDSVPDTVVLSVLPSILLSEEHDLTAKKDSVYGLLINNTIDVLFGMGVKFDVEYLDIKILPELINLLDFFFILDGYEDLIGLKDIMDSQDSSAKDRLLLALETYHGEDFDIGTFEYLIEDVSEVTLTALVNSLKRNKDGSEEDPTPASLKQRIIDNKELFKDCFVTNHIKMGGELGSPVHSLMAFFKDHLEKLLDNPTDDNMYAYSDAIILIYLISEENNHNIKEGCLKILSEVVDDYYVFSTMETTVNKLVLRDE